MEADSETFKQVLREDVRRRVSLLSREAKEEASARARELLHRQAAWQSARCVLLYAPIEGELDVWPVLGGTGVFGKVLALPRFDKETGKYVACEVKDPQADVVRGRYGVREPAERCEVIALKQLDFVLVPGVAFDLHGHRLGRGKGYYDRMLAEVRGRTCGVAFDEQIVSEVPVQPHDSDVNCILTPTRWIELK